MAFEEKTRVLPAGGQAPAWERLRETGAAIPISSPRLARVCKGHTHAIVALSYARTVTVSTRSGRDLRTQTSPHCAGHARHCVPRGPAWAVYCRIHDRPMPPADSPP